MPFSNVQTVVAAPSDGTVLLGIPPRPLTSGHRLRDYELKGVMARGACAAVYAAWDHALQREVAIQEFLPADLGRRGAGDQVLSAAVPRLQEALDAGRKGFIAEARLLARFDHPSLAKVYRFFEEDGTAYMVMPPYPGPTLRAALASLGHVPDEGELRTWLRPVLDALSVLHEAGGWHGHIHPDSILLTPMGPVLLGPALAERAIAQALHAPNSALVPGYAALEQYDVGAGANDETGGPWTDFYALAAVVRAAITSDEPQPANERALDDRSRPLASMAAGLYRADFLGALDAAFAVAPEARPRDHQAWRALMGDFAAPQRLQLAPQRDLMQEPFHGSRDEDRIITVPDRPVAGGAPAEAGGARPAAEPASSAAVTAPPTGSPAGTPEVAPTDAARRRRPVAPADARAETTGATAFGRPESGRRNLLYGAFATVFAAVGLGALGWQMLERGESGAAGNTAASASAAVPAPAPIAPVAPVAPVATALPGATPVPPTASASVVAPTAAPAASVAAPLTDAERHSRCIDILQRASLESLTPADTAFYTRECR